MTFKSDQEAVKYYVFRNIIENELYKITSLVLKPGDVIYGENLAADNVFDFGEALARLRDQAGLTSGQISISRSHDRVDIGASPYYWNKLRAFVALLFLGLESPATKGRAMISFNEQMHALSTEITEGYSFVRRTHFTQEDNERLQELRLARKILESVRDEDFVLPVTHSASTRPAFASNWALLYSNTELELPGLPYEYDNLTPGTP
jgi:hypothetical protein